MATYSVLASDNIVLSDVSKSIDVLKASDNIVLSDSPRTILTSYVSDNIEFTDNAKELYSVHETIVISDTSKGDVTSPVFASDSIRIVTAGKTVYSLSASDSIDFTDTSKLIYLFVLADSIALADTTSENFNYSIQVSETVSFLDTPATNIDFTDTLVDNVNIVSASNTVTSVLATDNIDFQTTSEGAIMALVTDNVVVSDVSTAGVVHREDLSDGITLVDDITATKLIRVNASDNVDFTTESELFRVYGETLTDTLVMSDAPYFNISDYIKTIFDTLDFTDDANQYVYYRKRTSDNVDIADVSINTWISTNHVEETISITDSCSVGTYFSTPNAPTNNDINITDTSKVTVSRDSTSVFTNALSANIGTSEDTLYTCTFQLAEIANISLANMLATEINVTVILYKGGSTPVHIVKDVPIGEGETFVINNSEMNITSIETNDEIRIISSDVASVDAYIAIVEI